MGNGEFAVSAGVAQQWEQLPGGSVHQFRNRISQEQFKLIILPPGKAHAAISDLIQRSIYPLPNTPRLILLNDQQEGVSLLVQQTAFSLRQLLAPLRIELQLFQIIHQIAATASSLARRHGPFAVSEHMLGGVSAWQPVIWVHEDYEECTVQYGLAKNGAGEKNMIAGLIAVLRDNSPIPLKQGLFMHPPETFPQLLDGLGRLIHQERCGLTIQLQSLGNKQTDPPYPLSPRRGRSGDPLLKLPAKQIKRQHPIPNFIKTLSKKTNPERQTRKDCKPSLGKVRSLHCSPTGKSHPRAHGNLSSATTNHSVISWNLSSQGISDLLSSKQSAKSKAPQSRHPHAHQDQQLFKAFSRKMAKLFPEEEPAGRERQSEVTFQKESEDSSNCPYGRPRFSFGSLNSFCRHLSQSAVGEAEGDVSVSVVIHHEEQQPMGEMTLKEEFSRILY